MKPCRTFSRLCGSMTGNEDRRAKIAASRLGAAPRCRTQPMAAGKSAGSITPGRGADDDNVTR